MNDHLTRLFEKALKLSIASCPLIIGCGGGGIDNSTYDLPLCDEGHIAVRDLNPAMPVEYVEQRVWNGINDTDPPDDFRVLNSAGNKCGGASMPAVCDTDFRAVSSTTGYGRTCGQICVTDYLAFTRGNSVGKVTSQAELAAFLGTIDTAQEAVLMARSTGVGIGCGEKRQGAVRQMAGGWQVLGVRGTACGPGTSVKQYRITVNDDGTIAADEEVAVLAYGDPGCVAGRRPGGLCTPRQFASASALGRHFANAAHLEWASVVAFEQLEHELAAHGAPWSLRLAARAAAVDERQHTVTMSRLARRFGATVQRPVVARRAMPALSTIARENAVEGCVRETFGALVAHRQAAKANDPEIARELQQIAVDETRHAALSWQLDGWAQRQLSRRERQALRAERRHAVETLRREAATRVDPSLVDAAGLPDGDEAVALVDQLDAGLFSEHG